MSGDSSTDNNIVCDPLYTRNQVKMHEDCHQYRRLVNTDGTILYECDFCERSCSDENEMNCHLKEHNGTELYECTDCQTSFADIDDYLNYHLNHTIKKKYKCAECNEKFLFEAEFKVHMEFHESHKALKCQFSDNAVRFNKKLEEHVQTHNEERSFKCEICGKTYTYRGNLTKHYLRKHNENNQFTCVTCNKNFSNKYALERHTRTECVKSRMETTFCPYSFEQGTFFQPSSSVPLVVYVPEFMSVGGALPGHLSQSVTRKSSGISSTVAKIDPMTYIRSGIGSDRATDTGLRLQQDYPIPCAPGSATKSHNVSELQNHYRPRMHSEYGSYRSETFGPLSPSSSRAYSETSIFPGPSSQHEDETYVDDSENCILKTLPKPEPLRRVDRNRKQD